MQYAIIQTGSKQYRVKAGDEIIVEKIQGAEGDKVTFDNVLLVADPGKARIGQPHLIHFAVTGKIVAQTKSKKIRVATYKAKSRYRKVKGHRQQVTRVAIEAISKKGRIAKKPSKR